MPANLNKLHQLTTGGVVELEILTPTSSKRVKTEFIGLLDKKFIILNYPSTKRLPGANDYLRDGVMVVVRAVIEGGDGQVIAFRQQIMSIASHPARLIFINFPKQVQSFELRSQTRIPTLLPAKLKLDDDKEVGGIIKDISLTGVMFEFNERQSLDNLKDKECTVSLKNSSNETKNFQGQLCSIKEQGDSMSCGIKILASENEVKDFMKENFIDPSILGAELD